MSKLSDSNGRLNAVGLYIKTYRKAHGFSLREFAGYLQIHGLDWDYRMIYRAETGARIVSDLEIIRLSEILNVSIDTLLDRR